MSYLNTLIENRKQVAASIEQIRSEWKGKEGTMPPDVEEKFDRAIADFDKLNADIAREEKADAVSKWAAELNPANPPVIDPNGKQEAKTDELREAFAKYLVMGERGESNYVKALETVVKAGMQADISSAGGYLLAPQAFVAELIKTADKMTFIRQLARVFPSNAEGIGAPYLATDASDAQWSGELTSSPETDLVLGKRELRPKELKNFVKVSRKLLDNAQMNVESIVMDRIAYHYANPMEAAYMTGNGVNKPLGLFTASADGIPTTRDKDTAASTTIAADDVIDLIHNVRPAYRARGTWILHSDNIAKIRKLKSGTSGDYVWNPLATNAQAIVGGLPGTICGRPYIESEYAPNGTTAGSYWALFGDLSNYWIVDLGTMYMQVLRELYARTSQIGYHTEWGTDGMPVLAEAFTRGSLKS